MISDTAVVKGVPSSRYDYHLRERVGIASQAIVETLYEK